MQRRPLPDIDQANPPRIDVIAFLLVVDAFPQVSQILLVQLVVLKRTQRRLRRRLRVFTARRLAVLRESLGLLLGRLPAFVLLLGLGSQGAVLLLQALLLGCRLLLRLLEFRFLVAQCLPRTQHRQQCMRLVVTLDRIRPHDRVRRQVSFLVVVFLLQPLHFSLRVASRLLQRLRGVVPLVLIKLQLGLGHIELVLQIFLLRLRRRYQLSLQLVDVVLVLLERSLRLIFFIGQLLECGRERRRILLRSAKGIEERQVDFMVRNLLRLVRQIFFFLRICQSAKPARRLQRALVHQDLRRHPLIVGGCRLTASRWGDLHAGAATLLRPHHSHDGRRQQQQQHTRGNPVPNLHGNSITL